MTSRTTLWKLVVPRSPRLRERRLLHYIEPNCFLGHYATTPPYATAPSCHYSQNPIGKSLYAVDRSIDSMSKDFV